jgi:photosystem II stability/assembly factor-like uncharacterized protein
LWKQQSVAPVATREKQTRLGIQAPIEVRGSKLWLVLGGLAGLAVVGVIGWFLLRPGASGPEDGTIATLQTLDQHALLFSPTDMNVVFFGHHNGVMRSDDGGRTWKPVVNRPGFDAMQLASAGKANPGRMYLAGHDIFQSSDDSGTTWRPVEHNLPGTDIHQFALDPDDANRLTAVVVGFGAFHSTDGGRTWTRLAAQPPPDVSALASGGGSPETLYVGTIRNGVLRSSDGGQTWTSASGGAASDAAFRAVVALAVDPSERQVLYAGTDSGLAKSSDAGSTWSALPYPGDNALAVAVCPTQLNVIVAVASSPRHQGLVYRSEDGGQSWGKPR